MIKVILLVEQEEASSAGETLRSVCRTLYRAKSEKEAHELVAVSDAVVIRAAAERMLELQITIARTKKLPIFWLQDSPGELSRDTDWGYSLDGLLFASMSPEELRGSILWGQRCFQQRKRWAEERDSLLQRIEERKWIDQAKSVLCEIKGISESEAYDFLRKQAMNERKRIGEVAANIVKVYQLIHG